MLQITHSIIDNEFIVIFHNIKDFLKININYYFTINLQVIIELQISLIFAK